MKKLILIFALLTATAAVSNALHAQHINVNINIGSQPAWGPVGYDYVDYYYMPDINVYYIVNSHSYVYLDGRRWVTARYLPYRYRNYDLYGMYKVVLVGGSRDPWRHNSVHYRDYGRYRNYRGQSVIRDSREVRYRDSRRNDSPWYRESSPNRVNSTRPNNRPNNSVRPSESSRPNNNNSRPTTTTRPSSSSRPSNNGSATRPTSPSRDNSSTRSSSRESSSDRSSTRSSSRNSNSSDFRTVNNSGRR